jgi:hypothetical protein
MLILAIAAVLFFCFAASEMGEAARTALPPDNNVYQMGDPIEKLSPCQRELQDCYDLNYDLLEQGNACRYE